MAVGKRKTPIRISRADVLSGELPARILAALDEKEINDLLGGEPARVKEARPAEFRKQIADFARTRQPALFESLYKGAGPVDPGVAKLQRLCPGLSESGAFTVLAQADAEELLGREVGVVHQAVRIDDDDRFGERIEKSRRKLFAHAVPFEGAHGHQAACRSASGRSRMLVIACINASIGVVAHAGACRHQ